METYQILQLLNKTVIDLAIIRYLKYERPVDIQPTKINYFHFLYIQVYLCPNLTIKKYTLPN